MNITEDYVSFEVAKLLKEKGFDEPCRAYWDDQPKLDVHTLFFSVEPIKNSERAGNDISCPTHQMAMKWLRESHNLQIQITPITSRYKDWTFGIDIDFSPLTIDLLCFPTYEEAVEEALKYSLENLI